MKEKRKMNAIYRLFLPATVAAGLAGAAVSTSCTRDLDTYEGESGIYFDIKWNNAETLSDTIWVQWGTKKSDETETELKLRVKLFGFTAPYDRDFDIKIETAIMPDGDVMPEIPDTVFYIPILDAAEGVDFEKPTLTYTMASGTAECEVPIKLLRRSTLNEAKRAFKVSLVENDKLKFLFSRAAYEKNEEGDAVARPMDLQRVIVQDETFSKPSWWLVFGDRYYGPWSYDKQVLICDHMNINRSAWLEPLGIPEGRHKYYARQMYLWLKDNPQYDSKGKLIEMGSDSSY